MTNHQLRLAFAGTPELARIVLESIVQSNKHKIELVFTQPDRPAGRGRALKQSEVKQYALEKNLPVLQPVNVKELDTESLRNCDLMLVVAYGLLITSNILKIPRLGCINIHTSLLPRWRGAAPIQRAIEAGDTKTGISIMQMDNGLDTGPILKQITCPIPPNSTSGDLHDRLAQIAAESINSILTGLATQQFTSKTQNNSLACYANKITKQEAELDWKRPVIELERKIRAFNPFPVAFTILNGVKIRIWESSITSKKSTSEPGTIIKNGTTLNITTSDGVLSIDRLQLPGRRIISAKEFLNGYPDFFTER